MEIGWFRFCFMIYTRIEWRFGNSQLKRSNESGKPINRLAEAAVKAPLTIGRADRFLAIPCTAHGPNDMTILPRKMVRREPKRPRVIDRVRSIRHSEFFEVPAHFQFSSHIAG